MTPLQGKRPSRRFGWVAWLAAFACLLFPAAGCARRTNPPTNPALALDSLRVALDHWQKGGTPQELSQRQPAIIMGDEEWEAGSRLVRYAILDGERNDGANLHVPVRLVLSDAQGGQLEQVVTYIVGTSPLVTIFRQ